MPKDHFCWDVFCRVIDNWGDVGVCWRLCAQLAARGEHVRLWIDDAQALRWMAPGAIEGQLPGIEVHPWSAAEQPPPALPRADVWIEAFGCDIPEAFIAHGVRHSVGTQPVWLNLEYLSAEGYVRRNHLLPSPVLQGPAHGWTKHFFYPGFYSDTGGLLREQNLAERQRHFDRSAWLAQHGIDWQGETLVSLFCYEPAALSTWLAQLSTQPHAHRLLVTAGRASAAVQQWQQQNPETSLAIDYLPLLTQTAYDELLWACDCNLVRGEDSVVRALWAGKPFIWHIYPQDDGAHHAKLAAFLDWLEAPASLRQFHQAWNADHGTPATPPLPWDLAGWQAITLSARDKLLQINDLATQLHRFVTKTR